MEALYWTALIPSHHHHRYHTRMEQYECESRKEQNMNEMDFFNPKFAMWLNSTPPNLHFEITPFIFSLYQNKRRNFFITWQESSIGICLGFEHVNLLCVYHTQCMYAFLRQIVVIYELSYVEQFNHRFSTIKYKDYLCSSDLIRYRLWLWKMKGPEWKRKQ